MKIFDTCKPAQLDPYYKQQHENNFDLKIWPCILFWLTWCKIAILGIQFENKNENKNLKNIFMCYISV